MSQTLDQRRGGPTQTPVTGPDPYPPVTAADKAQISGEGWELMIKRRKRVEG